MNDELKPVQLSVGGPILAVCRKSTIGGGHRLNVFFDVKANTAREYCEDCRNIFDIEDMRRSKGVMAIESR